MRHARAVAVQLGWLLVTLALFPVVYRWFNPGSTAFDPAARGAVAYAVLVGGTVVGIAVHEAAHALVGALAGFRVAAVVVGCGPVVARSDRGSVSWQLRLLPVGGATMMTTRSPWAFRTRLILSVGAGPAATALFALALIVWHPTSPQVVWARALLIWAHVLGVLVNLTPQKAFGEMRTDGGQIVDVLRDPARTFARQDVGADELAALVRLDRPDRIGAVAALDDVDAQPSRPGAQALAAVTVRLGVGDLEGAHALARRCLEGATGDEEPATSARLQNLAAYAALCLDRPALVPEADRLSAAALSELAEDAAVLDTRGWALVESGRPVEGRRLLERAAAVARGDAAVVVRAHLLCAAVADRDLLRARDLAERLPRSGGSDPSVAIALGRYRAAVDALTDEQRALLLATRTR